MNYQKFFSDYLMTCYTKTTNVREEQNPLGIVSGHAYSILDIKTVRTKNGQVRLIQIRNPWGYYVFINIINHIDIYLGNLNGKVTGVMIHLYGLMK